MNNKIKILGIVLIAVLALTAIGAGVAFAQKIVPNTGLGWMMGSNRQTANGYGMMGTRGMMGGQYSRGNANNGDRWEWMNAMHEWMTSDGEMHTFVWNSLAEKLGLTSDELYAEVNSGKTIAQVAEEQGISQTDLVVALETAHQASLAQAVTDGALTQEQSDSILGQMAGRYEWMIDNMGRGGMMGGQYGRSGMMNGQGDGCRGNWNGSPANQQPKP